jgi:hypothetical protein
MKTALEKIIAKAKQLKKSFPNTKWTDLVKKASTELKKSGAIGDFKKNKAEFVEAKTPKKPRKKRTRSANVYSVSRTATGRFKKKGMKRTHAENYSVRIAGVGAVKKPVKTSTHKDTKSHNVRISVMSGLNKTTLSKIDWYLTHIARNEQMVEKIKNIITNTKSKELKIEGKKTIINLKSINADYKKMITTLKKHIK